MSFKLILNIIISFFFVLGAVDYVIGDRFGLGGEFGKAFSYVGRIALSIVGMICLSPVIARVLTPVIRPLYTAIGIDPSMFISLILPPDSGAYPIAMDLAIDPVIGAWSGTVVAAHIGTSFAFNIPTCLGVMDKKNHRFFSIGALSGLIACPVGCILGGLMCGISLGLVLYSLIPTLIVAALLILGLIFKQDATVKGFQFVGKALKVVIIFGLVCAAIKRLTGFELISGMNEISDGFLTAGTIGISMAGIMCLIKIVSVVFAKPLSALSKRLGINEASILYCLITLCTAMPGAAANDEMNDRGKVAFAAIVIASGNILGAHLSYIGTNCPECLVPTLVGKIVSGILAVALALIFSRKSLGGEKTA